MPTKSNIALASLSRRLPYILIIGGLIALICAFIIMLDKLNLLANPHFQPNCDLNPVISCGSVMASKQGAEFGFPNPIIGLAAFPVFITIGVSQLAGAQFKRWFWQGLNGGLLLATIFIHWLFFESVYVIHALCPYCMAVWVMIITMFWYVTLYNLNEGNLKLPARFKPVSLFARNHHLEILFVWLLIIAILILHHFWYFYGKNL
ncbi:MAG: vitamin K epoxide reductase family protein [Candidatus Saccharimonadales bacterium]